MLQFLNNCNSTTNQSGVFIADLKNSIPNLINNETNNETEYDIIASENTEISSIAPGTKLVSSEIFDYPQPKGGYKEDFCPICKNFTSNIIALKCTHSACSNCLGSWIKKQVYFYKSFLTIFSR